MTDGDGGRRIGVRMAGAGVMAAAVVCGSCSLFSSSGSSLRVDSRDKGNVLEPVFTTGIYRFYDPNTVDVYLSDVPLERLLAAAEGGESEGALPAGNLVRVHLFLNPRAGYTPIDYTASNASFTHVVMTGSPTGAYGVYCGGGFVLPSGDPGGATFTGYTDGANLKLAASTAGFDDKLGPSEATGRVTATRDDEKAERIGALVSALARGAEK